MSATLSIVLVSPLIPQNTGNIARLSAATRTPLHLIEPLGFELSDRYLKRAGLDYWPETQITVHPDWDTFLSNTGAREQRLWLVTTRGERPYHHAQFMRGDYIVLGNESQGLAPWFHEAYPSRRIRIPMDNPKVRSLNLASAAAVVHYEARRQLGLLGD